MALDLKLERREPLADLTDAFARAGGDALQIEVVAAGTAVNLRGAPADESLVTDVQRVLGIELPLVPNCWHGDDRLSAIWLGPDEWLLVAGDGEAAQIEQALLEARAADPWLSTTDVSHATTRLVLRGAGVRDLLAKGCSLDLRSDAFQTGMCAQTALARSNVLLRVLDEDVFEIRVRNSLARYVAEWLLDACMDRQRVRTAPTRESMRD